MRTQAVGDGGPTIIDEVDLEPPADDMDVLAFAMYQKAVRLGTWQPSAVDLSRDKPDVDALDERHRYFGEVFGHRNVKTALANPVHDTLKARSRKILEALEESEEARTLALIEGTTHYMCVIEGVQAMTGYGIFHDVFTRKGLVPGLSEGYKLIRQDEGRHVGFGLRMLRHYAHRHPRYAAGIREIMEEYLPLVCVRYGQKMEVDDRVYEPPEEERGVERLMTLYNRRLHDIFGSA